MEFTGNESDCSCLPDLRFGLCSSDWTDSNMQNMSFSLTTKQVRNKSKTVTRRLGWSKLTPGTVLQAVRKCQGLKKGERVEPICLIRIKSVQPERLDSITAEDVVREGFPDMTPEQFVSMFCEHNKCSPESIVQRIEFDYWNIEYVAKRKLVIPFNSNRIQFVHSSAEEFTKPAQSNIVAEMVFLDPPFNIGQNYKGFKDRQKKDQFENMIFSAIESGLSWMSSGSVICLHGPDSLCEIYLMAMSYFQDRFPDLIRTAWVNWHYQFGQFSKTNWVDSRCHCLIYSIGKPKFNATEVLVPSVRLNMGDKRVADSEWKGMRLPGTVWGIPSDGPNWGRIQGNNPERWNHSPNQLPVRYLERLIRAYTDESDLIVDLFCGSGTTALVAGVLNRQCRTCDISESTVESAAERFKSDFDFVKQMIDSKR